MGLRFSNAHVEFDDNGSKSPQGLAEARSRSSASNLEKTFNGLWKTITLAFFLALSITLAGCSDNPASYSILAEMDQFTQDPSQSFNNKVDILWVIDSSGSMAPYQENLADNFEAFISEFTDKGFDYHMAVASTDGWIREFNYNRGSCWQLPNPSENPDTIYRSSADCDPTLATYGDLTHFRDGDIYDGTLGDGTRSGTYLLTNLMNPLDVIDYFKTNIRVGIRGDGRERGAQSLRATLRIDEDGNPFYGDESHTVLSSFRRSDAFLSVIFLSDEDDQSQKMGGDSEEFNYIDDEEYVSEFLRMMDGYTARQEEETARYSVSSIVILDEDTCDSPFPEQKRGDRYIALAESVNGIVADICSPSFSSDLTLIAEQVVSLVARFELSREPLPSTIRVRIDGEEIPEDAFNGWSYQAESPEGPYFVRLNGASIPAQGAAISINYDPLSVK